MPEIKASQWDKRPDGTTKGNGFLGPLVLPNGAVASEFSIADSEHLKDAHGNYLDYPSLVPTLTKDEVHAVMRSAASDGKVPLPDSVYRKAEAFAIQRRKAGLPLFAQPGEQYPLYPDLPRAAVQQQSGDVTLPNESGLRDPRLAGLYGTLGSIGMR